MIALAEPFREPSNLPAHTTKTSSRLELVHLSPILIPVNITYCIIYEKTLKIYTQKSRRYVE
jgi:hypothetical protein